jgi:RNA polymerase sigma factor (sigma-70 family)
VFQVHADICPMTPRALFHPARLARRPVLSTQSDERLVDLVRAGSDPAFEAIVERYRRALMRYVSRLLPPERAEDVVQQSFVKAYEAMHKGSAELNLKPWLYRIAHNGALNALRDRGLRHAELSEAIDGVERPDQAFERNLGLRELVVAVQALPERQRSAILLRELEGRSYDEIALALGVSDGAVRQLLNRARNTLRAAAASVMPLPLVERVAASASSEPVAGRVAELVGVGGGAFAMKLCATALVTGAVVGGAAVVPDVGRESRDDRGGLDAAQAAEDPDSEDDDSELEDGGSGGSGGSGSGTQDRSGRGGGSGREGRRGEDGERRSGDDGRRSGEGERSGGGGSGDDGHSGPSGGGERRDGGGDGGHSGPGGGGERDGGSDDGHSGPGGGGGGSSGPGDGTTLPDDDNSGPGGGGDPIEEPAEVRETDDGGSGGGNSGPGGGGDDGLEPDPLDGSGSGR